MCKSQEFSAGQYPYDFAIVKAPEAEELSAGLRVFGGGKAVGQKTVRAGALSSRSVSAAVPSSQLNENDPLVNTFWARCGQVVSSAPAL